MSYYTCTPGPQGTKTSNRRPPPGTRGPGRVEHRTQGPKSPRAVYQQASLSSSEYHEMRETKYILCDAGYHCGLLLAETCELIKAYSDSKNQQNKVRQRTAEKASPCSGLFILHKLGKLEGSAPIHHWHTSLNFYMIQ